MRIALTHNLRLTDNVDEAEFDLPETIDAIAQALVSAGHDVERIEVSGPASRLVARLEAYAPDLIFNTAEGRRGRTRRAFYPALFEQLGIPSTGPDAYTLCITLDKALTKKIAAGFGVASPRARLSVMCTSLPTTSQRDWSSPADKTRSLTDGATGSARAAGCIGEYSLPLSGIGPPLLARPAGGARHRSVSGDVAAPRPVRRIGSMPATRPLRRGCAQKV